MSPRKGVSRKRRDRGRGPKASATPDAGYSRRQVLIAAGSGVAVAGAGIGLGLASALRPPGPVASGAQSVSGAGELQRRKGSADAPVRMVNFSSYTCPHCAAFALETEPLIDQTYVATGKVLFTFMHSPFDPLAERASQAAECAADQGGFWPYHRELMARQRSLQSVAYDTSALAAIAEDLKLDIDRFLLDLGSGKQKARVKASLEEGKRLGVTGVPAFFINDVKLVGNLPWEQFAGAIDAELRKSGRG